MSDVCVFCKIGQHQIPAMIVYEDDDFIAFRDIAPKAPVHVMLSTKKHYCVLHECTEQDREMLGRMMLAVIEVARKEGLLQSGYRVVLNGGRTQAIEHLHAHIMGGRTFSWPPG
jgi:histidine triad (HIT) family protein